MAGIYIHIPFCKKKCSYCDFHFSTTFSSYRDKMVKAIIEEIKQRKNDFDAEEIKTIYFGGGTPSLLTEEELYQILNVFKDNFSISEDAEVTLEANPDDITDENLFFWKKHGVNRLSIGLQSFKESDLRWMNRSHTVEQSFSSILKAQMAGFDNLTVDLMYGLPDLSLKEWEQHILQSVQLDIPHISAYCLTVEQKTALYHYVKKKNIYLPNEDMQSDQFKLLVELLEEKGYEQYEISNFCIPGKESIHNSNYWRGEKYMGIGPSAHSFNGKIRRWNVANNHRYMEGVLERKSFFEQENLSNKDLFNEYLLLGLRTKYGVNLSILNSFLPLDEDFQNKTKVFIERGDMIKEQSYLFLTKQGRLLADYITSELFVV